MERREALRLLAAGAILPLTPRELRVVLHQARTLLADQHGPRTLDAHQYDTVKVIAELILPRTETPGATDVGAVDFIDLMLTEWYDNQNRTVFLRGLADLDAHAKTLFGKVFLDCSPDQQADLLISLGAATTVECVDIERADLPGRNGRRTRERHENFYSMLRRLTLTAYYTSEAGATEELNFQIIPGRYDGCMEEQSGNGKAEKR